MDLNELKKTIENILNIDLNNKVRCLDYVDGRIIFCLIALIDDENIRNRDISKFLKKHHSTITHYRRNVLDLLRYNKVFSEKYKLCVSSIFQGDISRFFDEEIIKKATLINKYTM